MEATVEKAPAQPGAGAKDAAPDLQKGGAYEVLRARLAEHCQGLRERVEKLNTLRKEVFGGMETALAASARIKTEHSCIPRDIIHLGRKLIVGYDVFLGLKKETELADVFAVYDFDGREFKSLGVDFLNDPGFEKDFKEIFKYYKGARLSQLRNTGTHLLFVFQIGASLADLKVCRWALQPDGSAKYVDNRGEREHVFPPQFDFEWTRTTREQQVAGQHPHVSIQDQIFVECVGGDLTVKIENNTQSGKGIYSEPVDDADQSLDDAEIQYAILQNLILLKIKPFGEQAARHLVYNRLTQRARRIDAIGQACVQLPEGHGVIFPGGYHLQTGEARQFDENVAGMEFFKSIRSANGEDVLYLFYQREAGSYILLQYNLVKKEVSTPILCHGYSLYPDGLMVVFRKAGEDASRTHAVQIWRTPFVGEGHEFATRSDSYLGKIGNKELVNGISEALTLAKLAQDVAPSAAAYENLVKSGGALLDRYHWLAHAECFDLAHSARQIREAGEAIIEEFEKVVRVRANTTEQIAKFSAETAAHLQKAKPDSLRGIDEHVQALAQLRSRRGQAITLRELRYADLPALQAIEDVLVQRHDEISRQTVKFLLGPEALKPYGAKLDLLLEKAGKLEKVSDAAPLKEEADALGEGLDLLAEIVNNLKIDDSTARTEIIESLSGVYAHLNRARAQLAARRKELLGREQIAEFGAQFKLLTQGLASYIALCDAPEKCDEFLGKLLVQVEELEGRFSDFPEFSEKIAEKRDEIYNAFSARKQALLDERQRKCSALFAAADRILKNVARRAQSFTTADELNGYYASDPMVAKAADIASQLRELGDGVKADDLASRLKSGQQDAQRLLRDKLEIFEEGANVIKFGRHRFSVNTEPLDVSLTPRDGRMCFHITGTDYHDEVTDEAFLRTGEFWEQDVPSENAEVYRCEYLSWKMIADAEAGRHGLEIEKLMLAAASPDGLLPAIHAYSSELYDEGYERGLHDHDTALILAAALNLRAECGLLRFDPCSRAHACIFWSRFDDSKLREMLMRKAQSLGRMAQVYQADSRARQFVEQLAAEMRRFFEAERIDVSRVRIEASAGYLARELAKEHSEGFATCRAAVDLQNEFLQSVGDSQARAQFEHDLKSLENDLHSAFDLARAWLGHFLEKPPAGAVTDGAWYADEAAAIFLTQNRLARRVLPAAPAARVEGLLGQHRNIVERALVLRYDEFLQRVSRFALETAPRYREYQALRKQLVEKERGRLRLDEFKPKTMSTFVRNRLINDVYLPLIGENLGKQMGEAGAAKRTDLMGLLLLISPPGYGKTTLMEYVASRLGLTFMKINGPALGTGVVSLDPAEAPNATSREEVEKLNLSLEMGNNVMIYVDDIQHTNPEFLQKFISLCDAQRKIEGVYRGRTRTYDFRGKKVCVAMAGNPYTESGARFQIPDMLANRADTYNLGDIIGGRQDLFELSYLENCITSSPVLAPLARRDPKDFYTLAAMAHGKESAESDLGHDYSAIELKDMLETIRKLRVVQKTVLRVNQEYIASASQKDEYRTEPPFKLQGSYRNMNKIAGKVLPVLSDAELEGVVADHYLGEAQALASGAEHNLLKLAEVRGKLSPAQAARWDEIKRSFNRNQMLHGADKDDKAAHVVAQLASFNDNLDRIRKVISDAAANGKHDAAGDLAPALEKLGTAMQAAMSQSASDQNERLGGQLAAALERLRGAEECAGKEAPKFEIVNTLPAYYLNLYKQHIDMIEGVLVPVVKGLGQQIKSSDEIHGMLVDVSARMKSLLAELGQQKRRKRGEHDPE